MPLILRSSKRKNILLLASSIAFVGMAFVVKDRSPMLSVALGVFFGLSAVVFCVKLLPQASYLEIRPEGFVMCELFRRSEVFRWETLSEFSTVKLPKCTLVVFDEYEPRRPVLARSNKLMFGFTSALADTYGLAAGKLKHELNQWRDRSKTST